MSRSPSGNPAINRLSYGTAINHLNLDTRLRIYETFRALPHTSHIIESLCSWKFLTELKNSTRKQICLLLSKTTHILPDVMLPCKWKRIRSVPTILDTRNETVRRCVTKVATDCHLKNEHGAFPNPVTLEGST
jgi:hypothetical protein